MTEGTSSLAAATDWIASLLQGSLSTTVAVLAIAFLGFALIFGHVSLRSATRIVLGCFILFGSSMIARGMMGMADTGHSTAIVEAPGYSLPIAVTAPPQPVALPPPAAAPNGNPFNPYPSGR